MNSLVNFFDECHQSSVLINKSCNLKCSFCHLAENKVEISNIIASEMFKELQQKSKQFRLVNIIGGEPLIYENILNLLPKNKAKIRLFTNLSLQVLEFEKIVKMVNEWVVYIPVRNKRDYRLLTGYDSYKNLLINLKKLYNLKQSIILNMPVFAHNLTYVPDIHELSRSLNAKLWLNFNPLDFSDKDSKLYLKRYNKIKGVRVFKIKNRSKDCCPAIPKNYINGSLLTLLQQVIHKIIK